MRLFSQDESRYGYGLFPVVSRRITLPGIKPVGEIDYGYESVYLYGAVEPLTGERVFYEFSHLTADCFQIFLNKFSHAFPESLNLLVLDNGRFHHAKCLEIPDNVLLLFLPPYSPELNPIERFWQDIKAKICRIYEIYRMEARKLGLTLQLLNFRTLYNFSAFCTRF